MASSASVPLPLLVKPAPTVQVTFKPASPQSVDATFVITMPRAQSADFNTQALALNNINFVKLEVNGIGISAPLFADGADSNGRVPNAGGTFTLTVNNLPFGSVRVATLSCYDAAEQPIAGATVKGSFHVNSATSNTELSFRSTPAAEVIESLMDTTPKAYLASQLGLSQLSSFIDALTGFAGVAPDYTYTTHPVLINASAIAADLEANGGNIAELDAENPTYKIAPGRIDVTLAGLIGEDTATLTARDPASAEANNQSNGARQVLNVAPGIWKLEGTAVGYLPDRTPTVTLSAGETVDAGTLTFSVTNAPNISTLSANSGVIGTSFQINGSHFHTSIDGNTVTFDGVIATVTAASPTQLTVIVPSGISGNQSVKVNVGGQNSNEKTFALVPTLTGISTNDGNIGSTLTLTGTGFSTTSADNTVTLSGIPATVISATSTELQITVPQAPSGNVLVNVAGQTSSGQAFNVTPGVVFTSPSNNTTVFGNISLTAQANSGNPITQVEFFEGSTSLGVDTSAPYSINWDTTSQTSGTKSITARVTDSQTNQANSPPINVTVNLPPTIAQITASVNPLPGLSYPVLLNCQASDTDSTLTNASYTWRTDGGDFGQFSSTQGSQVFWTAPSTVGGPYTLRCSVTDGYSTTERTQSISVLSGTSTLNGTGGLF